MLFSASQPQIWLQCVLRMTHETPSETQLKPPSKLPPLTPSEARQILLDATHLAIGIEVIYEIGLTFTQIPGLSDDCVLSYAGAFLEKMRQRYFKR